MKKNLLLSALSIGLIAQSSAQVTVANGSFETWTTTTVGAFPFPAITIEKAASWSATDEIIKNMEPLLTVAGGYVSSVNAQLSEEESAENVYEGSSSARLETKDNGGEMGNTPCLIANGVMTINMTIALEALEGGEIDGLESVMDVTGGTAIAGRKVDSVTVYLKGGAVLNPDSSSVFVQAKRVSGDTMITIGGGLVKVLGTDEFQKVVVPVDYTDLSLTATDTLVIFAVSSATVPVEGSMFGATAGNTIYLDDFGVFTSDGTTSVEKFEQTDLGIKVFPIPAGSLINFDNVQVKSAVINIYNAVGKLMHQEFVGTGRTTVDLTKYAAGNYFYEFINNDTYQKQVGQFVK